MAHGNPPMMAQTMSQVPMQAQAPPPQTVTFFLHLQDQVSMYHLSAPLSSTIQQLMRDLAAKLHTTAPFLLYLDGVGYLSPAETVKDSPMEDGCSVTVIFTYRILEKLGFGTFASVYKARNEHTNEEVAMKRSQSEYVDEGMPASTLREISALRELDHPNIIPLKDVLVDSNRITVVLELAHHDLAGHLTLYIMQPADICSFMYQMLQAIKFSHDHRVVHRDLKPQNILIQQNGVLKIADFGLARAFQYPMESNTPETVTLWYRAPELLLGLRNYTPLVDMWSVGAIMGEMSKGQPLFPGECEVDAMFKIFRLLGTPTADEWAGVAALPHFRRQFPKWTPANLRTHFPAMDVLALDLLKKMLKLDPEQRYSPDQALRHPYFNSHKVHKLRQQAAAPQQQMVHAP
eukprot:TRINITY_DN3137_c1_g1_i5.p1 TRINITY_DN3137_c1_g1~~TRINITY_DN3137_c1_g1_i5.p1  ORF type:complete len:404 (+),score=157.39 TRINITY_DN3137_c1_g1_i5:242-1453(+)